MGRMEGSLARFIHQYLQLEKTLDYPAADLLRQSWAQEALYESLFADGAVRFSPPPRYRLRVLKELLQRIEASIDDWDEHGVSEDLMSSLTEMLAVRIPPETETVQQMDYVTYHLSLLPDPTEDPTPGVPANCITLRESRGLLAQAGATGFRTWEAGLHIGQYLCSEPGLVRGKRVLELGAGTGHTSVLCAKYLGAAKVIASDGSDEVLAGLADTVFLNGLQGSSVFVPKELVWGTALLGTEEEKWNGGEEVDVVLGSDITYDPTAIPALLATLDELFNLYPLVQVIISTAERNVKTLNTLLDGCRDAGMTVTWIDFDVPKPEEQQGPFYDTSVPIHIVNIKRNDA
ncbi:uncharacterized protein DNG_09259 [Cephalotrichum gorgonifer]|uniref:Methyltransf_16 domain-containing protein n=1 Tax=Cephalotrichum gorgonifer TaxID=2041049 RepID=A0AAE8SZ68_9PEZI|nr:uncharacterized protein DNG_09259 [Cephalotrichum gorgonifer]